MPAEPAVPQAQQTPQGLRAHLDSRREGMPALGVLNSSM